MIKRLRKWLTRKSRTIAEQAATICALEMRADTTLREAIGRAMVRRSRDVRLMALIDNTIVSLKEVRTELLSERDQRYEEKA